MGIPLALLHRLGLRTEVTEQAVGVGLCVIGSEVRIPSLPDRARECSRLSRCVVAAVTARTGTRRDHLFTVATTSRCSRGERGFSPAFRREREVSTLHGSASRPSAHSSFIKGPIVDGVTTRHPDPSNFSRTHACKSLSWSVVRGPCPWFVVRGSCPCSSFRFPVSWSLALRVRDTRPNTEPGHDHDSCVTWLKNKASKEKKPTLHGFFCGHRVLSQAARPRARCEISPHHWGSPNNTVCNPGSAPPRETATTVKRHRFPD